MKNLKVLSDFLDKEKPERRTDAEALMSVLESGDIPGEYFTIVSRVWEHGTLTVKLKFINGKTYRLDLMEVLNESD